MPPEGYEAKEYEGEQLYVCSPPCPFDTFEEERMEHHQLVIHGENPPEDTPASMRTTGATKGTAPAAAPTATKKPGDPTTTHEDAGTGATRPPKERSQ